MANILIVDDDNIFCTPFSQYIEGMGHQCEIASNLNDGLKMARKSNFDIVFLDVVLPDSSGLEGIDQFKKTCSTPEVIIITGHGDSDGAEIALKNGAWDYLVKPPSYSNIRLLIGRGLKYREKKLLYSEKKFLDGGLIIGNNVGLKDCLEISAKAAGSDEGVFITGETGTGKDLIAKAIHLNSSRANKNFVPVDCTNIPVNLAESLLFGHLKGSFTGADKNEDGLIAQADGGTLFLDEVGDLDLSVQKSLLRVLQEKKYRTLGSNIEKDCDFRVISASNKDLKKMVQEDKFRKDLYFRLVVFYIELPQLRERLEDIKLLTHHYVYKICDKLGINSISVSKDFIDTLRRYDWPGNIRELINTFHITIANAIDEPVLYPHHLPLDLRVQVLKSNINKNYCRESKTKFLKFSDYKKLTESKYMDDLITESKGKVNRACEIAGISRSGLYNLLNKHNKKMK